MFEVLGFVVVKIDNIFNISFIYILKYYKIKRIPIYLCVKQEIKHHQY